VIVTDNQNGLTGSDDDPAGVRAVRDALDHDPDLSIDVYVFGAGSCVDQPGLRDLHLQWLVGCAEISADALGPLQEGLGRL
jgi:hypothetical protein